MTEKKTCFVICPIGPDNTPIRDNSDNLYTYIIKPIAEELNYDVIRADHIREPGSVSNQVISQLYNANLVVADLSDNNPNVFYELAIRHMVDLPIIHMIRTGQKIPFDISLMRTIYYDTDLKNGLRARKELEEQIRSIEDGTFKYDNPISSAKLFKKINDASHKDFTGSMEGAELIINAMNRIEDRVEHLSREISKVKSDDRNYPNSSNQMIAREMENSEINLIKSEIGVRLNEKAKLISLLESTKSLKSRAEYERRLAEIERELNLLDQSFSMYENMKKR
jgi:hypothetical protein